MDSDERLSVLQFFRSTIVRQTLQSPATHLDWFNSRNFEPISKAIEIPPKLFNTSSFVVDEQVDVDLLQMS